MNWTVRPAVREKIGGLIGLAGPSGSGKTMTALLLAHGIAGDGKIGFIDTEASRALHYAPAKGKKADWLHTFDFLHLDFAPPFSPERYIEAIRALEAEGVSVIVIDSMTHEWSGEGGCSDIQEGEARRMATDRDGNIQLWKIEAMTAPAWKKPKLLHQRMMARLIQCRTHLIFCLRAQEKIKIVKKADGKGTEIVPVGFQPITEKNFLFELTCSMMLHPERPGSPDYSLQHKLNDQLQQIFPNGVQIGPDAGRRLREWLETGEDRKPLDKAEMGVRDLIEKIQDADKAGLAAMMADAAVVKQISWLEKNRPDLKAKVDAAFTDAKAIFEIEKEPENV